MLNDSNVASDLPVLVIGAAGWDMVGSVKSDLIPHTSNPAEIRLSFGGAARNVAENLLRLGTPVTLLTVVGRMKPGNGLSGILKAWSECRRRLAFIAVPNGVILGSG